MNSIDSRPRYEIFRRIWFYRFNLIFINFIYTLAYRLEFIAFTFISEHATNYHS